MQKIFLSNILPQIFDDNPPQSEVWRKQVAFERGRFYLIEADSGKGKSSLFGYIYGYRHDFDSDIFFDGKKIKEINSSEWDELRKNSLSILFQDLKIFPELTAWENIQLKNSLTAHHTDSRIFQMLSMLEIEGKAHKRCEKLSWGQQQRVAIIRALCQPFDFLLLDEPISHIDDRMADIVARLITEEANAQGAAVIASSIGKALNIKYDTIFHL